MSPGWNLGTAYQTPRKVVTEDSAVCRVCGTAFQLAQVEAHILDHHLGQANDYFDCGECQFSTVSFGLFAAHCLRATHDAGLRVVRHEQEAKLFAFLAEMQTQALTAVRLTRIKREASPPLVDLDASMADESAPGTATKDAVSALARLLPQPSTPRQFEEEMAEDDDEPPHKPVRKAKRRRPIPTATQRRPPPRLPVAEAPKAEVVVCALCEQPIKAYNGNGRLVATSLRYHVMNRHYKGDMYKCGSCEHNAARLSAAKQHSKKAHGGGAYTEPPTEAGPGIWAEMELCFPLLAAHATRDSAKAATLNLYAPVVE